MNQDVKKLWLEALRSNEYEQGKRALCKENIFGERTFCCLGVLCDLYVKQNNLTNIWPARRLAETEYIPFDGGLHYYLPEKVMEWAGLTQINPHVTNFSGVESNLASCNDGDYSFEEIAKIIEEQL